MVQIGVPESVLTAVTAFRMEWERPSAFMLALFLSGKAGAYGQNARNGSPAAGYYLPGMKMNAANAT